MKKHTHSFNAIDKNGYKYTIDAYVEYVRSSSLQGAEAEPSLESYFYQGKTVNKRNNNTYYIVDLVTEVTKAA